MATVVVSGRVDEHVKRRVDEVLARAGKTPAEVIGDLWVRIYQTGRLPDSPGEEELFEGQRRRFADFLEFVCDEPPTPDWLVTLTDKELHEMKAADYVGRFYG